ncbi:MAG TPA: Fe(2+)-trafficking protein [Phycisphaerales bacterium]|nr:Fe(2+)-trafficking protein [Phycisphaerales bacterium]HMP37456.1 Fe(2+)-trafficking protein [Phycisphaerales bacterium]
MSTATRIEQFEKMAAADPENDMAHFSLGRAYLDAGRSAEAARSFERCVELNPAMSKAYELGGRSMIAAGWADRAVGFLTSGYETATRRGDRLPQQAIAELLRSIGREPPALASEAALPEELPAGTFVCRRTGRPGTKLDRPPFRGPVGAWIQENISAETWRTWIGQGTKVINELRLDFSRDRDQETYDRHMREYLGIDEELLSELTGPGRAHSPT